MASKYKFEDVYKCIPDCKNLEYDYKDSEIIKMPLRNHYLLLGATGSKKTSWIINFIKHVKAFSRIWVFAKDINEPLYTYLRSVMMKYCEKKKDDTLFFMSDNINEFPDFNLKKWKNVFKNRSSNQLIIVDDLIAERQVNLIRAFLYGRKIGITLCYISQSKASVPKLIRRNASVIVIKKQLLETDYFEIYKEYKHLIHMSFDNFMVLCSYIESNPDDAIVLDGKTSDKDYQLRINFVPLCQTKFAYLLDKQ